MVMAYCHHGEHTKHISTERDDRPSPRQSSPAEAGVATLRNQHRRKSPTLSRNRMPSRRKREGDGRRVATMPANEQAKGLRVHRRHPNRRQRNQSNGHRTLEPQQGTQLHRWQGRTNLERVAVRPLCRRIYRDIGGKLMARKAIDKDTYHRHAKNVRKTQDADTGEWRIRIYRNGKPYIPADYFTDCLWDATETHVAMIMEEMKHNESN